MGVILAYLFNRLAGLVLSAPSPDVRALLDATSDLITAIKSKPLYLSLHKESLMAALGGLLIAGLTYCNNVLAAPNRRPEEEHGSAVWGTLTDAKKYQSKLPENDILLTEHVRLALHSEELPFEHRKNSNVLIVGGSGSGKTYSIVLPNLMQMHSSFVVTDPNGTL